MNSMNSEFGKWAEREGRPMADRLAAAGIEQTVTVRARQARRRTNALRGLAVGASAVVLGIGAWAVVPNLGAPSLAPATAGPTPTASPTAAPTPAPSPTLTEQPDPGAQMPAIGADGFLAAADLRWPMDAAVTCEAVMSEPYGGEYGGEPAHGARAPIPAWLEDGRLYGWGDDVLIGGYPAPLAQASDVTTSASVEQMIGLYGNGNAVLVLTSASGEHWGFDVTWGAIEDPVHDAPGTFVTLSANWECSTDGAAPEGSYAARLGYVTPDGTNETVQLEPITVVHGVPSLPEVHARG